MKLKKQLQKKTQNILTDTGHVVRLLPKLHDYHATIFFPIYYRVFEIYAYVIFFVWEIFSAINLFNKNQ